MIGPLTYAHAVLLALVAVMLFRWLWAFENEDQKRTAKRARLEAIRQAMDAHPAEHNFGLSEQPYVVDQDLARRIAKPRRLRLIKKA